MFEYCNTLTDCEDVINNNIKKVKMINELPLTESDLNKLNSLFSVLKNNWVYIINDIPGSLSCFLVLNGIYNYKDAQFWPYIENVLGKLDSNNQVRLAEVFLSYIKKNNLINIDLPNMNSYVTPILFQGGIPNSCLYEYFNNVIRDFAKKNIYNKSILQYEIENIKNKIDEFVSLQKYLDILMNKKMNIRNDILDIRYKYNNNNITYIYKTYVIYKNRDFLIHKINELEKEINNINESYKLSLINIENKYNTENNNIKNLKKILDNKQRKIEIQTKIKYYEFLNEENENKIVNLFKNIVKSNNDRDSYLYISYLMIYGYDDKNTFFKINQNKEMNNNLNEIKSIFKDLKQNEEQILALKDKLNTYEEMAVSLDYDYINNLNLDVVDIVELEKIYNKKLENNNQNYIKLTNTIKTEFENKLNKLNNKINEEYKKLIEIDSIILRNNYYNFKDIINLLSNIISKYDWIDVEKLKVLPLIVYNLYKNDEIYLDLVKKLNDIENKIKYYQKDYNSAINYNYYIDRPIWRYLLFGDDNALNFLYNSMKLYYNLTNNIEFGNDDINLPDRVIIAIKDWYTKRYLDNIKSKKITTDIKYYTPYLYIDLNNLTVNINMPEQILPYDDNIEAVKIEFYNGFDKFIYPLDAIKIDDKLKVEKKAIMIENISTNYKIDLIINNEIKIKSWEIDGIDNDLMFFNQNGKRLSAEQLNSNGVILLINKKYVKFENIDIINIFDECVNLNSYFIYSANILNSPIKLIDKIGNDYLINIKINNDTKVMLEEPESLIECEKKNTYIGNFPYLYLPKIPENQMKLWSIGIFADNKDDYFFTYLNEISKESYAVEDMYMIIDIGNLIYNIEPYGKFGIFVNGPAIYQVFDIVVLPYFEIKFNKSIYGPIKEKDKNAIVEIKYNEGIFTVENDFYFESSAGDIKINCPIIKEKFHIIYNYHDEQFDILIKLPIIKYKLMSKGDLTEWTIEYNELYKDLWDEQELSLLLNLPNNIIGEAKININDDSNNYEIVKIKNGIAKFDLLQFIESINNSQDSIKFILSIYDKNTLLFKSTLFVVRTNSQIINFDYHFINDSLKNFIYFSWNDTGKQKITRIKIIGLNSGFHEEISYVNNINNAKIEINDISDTYIVNFLYENSWNDNLEHKNIFIMQNNKFPKLSYKLVEKTLNIYGNLNKKFNLAIISLGNVNQNNISKHLFYRINLYGDFNINCSYSSYMHWLLFYAWNENEYVTKINIIKNGREIEFLATKEIIKKIKPFIKYIKIKLFPYMYDVNDSDIYISKKYNEYFLKFITSDKELANIKLDNYEEPIKVYKRDNQIIANLKNGVICTSCGKLLKSQDEWDKFHYPKCKSFFPKYSKVNIYPIIQWNYNDILNNLIASLGIKNLKAIDEVYEIFNGNKVIDINNLLNNKNCLNDFITQLIDAEIDKALSLLKIRERLM